MVKEDTAERDADRVILPKRRDMKIDTSRNDEYIRCGEVRLHQHYLG